MSALCCPHCGKAIFLIDGDPRAYDGAAAAKRQAEPEEGAGLPRCYFERGKWSIDCPGHGHHAATVLQARDGKPAVVKCTASGPDGYCTTRVPLEDAKRMAGVSS